MTIGLIPLGVGGGFVQDLENVEHDYRDVCTELTAAQWAQRPRMHRYVDNVMRLTSALQ